MPGCTSGPSLCISRARGCKSRQPWPSLPAAAGCTRLGPGKLLFEACIGAIQELVYTCECCTREAKH